MNFYIVIPVHNEAKFIRACILSLISQSLLPKKIIIVNDSSSDNSREIVKKLESEFSIIKLIDFNSFNEHIPGKKVIKAFNYGLNKLDENYDIICKFDGDLIFDQGKPDGTPRKLLDVSRLKQMGWEYKVELKEGLQTSYEWFLRNEQLLRMS